MRATLVFNGLKCSERFEIWPWRCPFQKTELFHIVGTIVAVNDLSLGISHGECFGLLGQNGAGKTTTFKILTGDETASDGHAYIENYDVSRNLAEVRKESNFNCYALDALTIARSREQYDRCFLIFSYFAGLLSL